MHLDLMDEERDALVRVLDAYRTNLWREISHTDALEFKEVLRERDRIIMQILQKLGVDTHAAAA